MKKIFITIVLIVFYGSCLLAQRPNLTLDINGLVISQGKVYADSIYKYMGQPSSYESSINDFYNTLNEEYNFGPNLLRLRESGYLSTLILKDNSFAIFTKYISGGIRVGDPVNKFYQLGATVEIVKIDTIYNEYHVFNVFDTDEFCFKQENGIITVIYVVVPY